MAYAPINSTLRQSAMGTRINALLIDMQARLARRKVYNTTYRELAALSNRELADLGLNRSQLRRIAWEAAYEV